MEKMIAADPMDMDPRAGSTRRSSRAPIVIALIVLALGAALWFGRSAFMPRTAPPAPPPPVSSGAPEATPAAPSDTAIKNPLPDVAMAEGATPAEPLPALGDSDALLARTLSDLVGAPTFATMFFPDDMVRRFVVTIDNLPRRAVPRQLAPLHAPGGGFTVAATNGGLSIAPQNTPRYAPYLALVDAVDAHKVVAAYVHLYPLFQEQYRLLGYPTGHFNDRVVEAIDDLLLTPAARDPIALVQPKVLYEYADPDLEGLSAGQKTLLRMGSEPAARIQAKLREIRRELTAKR